jgi:PAS domain S-box-containing protein
MHDASLAGIARDALLDHLDSGDARHALQLLLSALQDVLGVPCALTAGGEDELAPRWSLGRSAGLQAMPLRWQGRRQGNLWMPPGAAPAALEPLLTSAAALLHAALHASDGQARRARVAPIDITTRRAAEPAASETSERLTRIARHVPGMLFQYRRLASGQAMFPYVSQRCVALFGVAPEELESDAAALLRQVDFGDRQTMLDTIDDSARTLLPWRLDFRVHRRDGQVRWMRGEASPQQQADGAVVWHGYIEDATERRDLERAQQDAAIAAAANRAKTQFLSRMSHELRTPLNAVLGFTQLIEIDRAEPPTPGQQRRLKLVREAGEHLLQMIGDLLDLTRIESGGMAIQFDDVDLRAAAAEALEMLRSSAETAQVGVTLLPGGEAPVRTDRTRLRQVLLNLLSNAIKYNRAGGSVLLGVYRAGEHEFCISVQDTGIGIAPADLSRVFEAFYRGSGVSASVEGAGIGLSVTQALVALMGGRIDVRSEIGSGSTFSVTLPAASAARP